MTITDLITINIPILLSKRCRHCHGNLVYEPGDKTLFCIQCAREHTMDGELIPKLTRNQIRRELRNW